MSNPEEQNETPEVIHRGVCAHHEAETLRRMNMVISCDKKSKYILPIYVMFCGIVASLGLVSLILVGGWNYIHDTRKFVDTVNEKTENNYRALSEKITEIKTATAQTQNNQSALIDEISKLNSNVKRLLVDPKLTNESKGRNDERQY